MIKMKRLEVLALSELTVVLYTKTSIECGSIKSHDRIVISIGITAITLVRDVCCIMCVINPNVHHAVLSTHLNIMQHCTK